MKTFKILGLLLTYPEGTFLKARQEILETLRAEAILPSTALAAIESFFDLQCAQDLLSVQEDYVDTFDRGRAHCLHLFEHIHGESRDRGQAMIDLIETYKSKGLAISNNELPDYLPMFMEYLSCCSFDEAQDLLGDAIDVISLIGLKLKQRNSPYAYVFMAIETLSSVKPEKEKLEQALKEAPKDPETLDELDEEWEEAEAFGGDPLEACSSCNQFPNAIRDLEKQVGGA